MLKVEYTNPMSNIEYEVKVLDIDVNLVEQKILDLGGKKLAKQQFKRYIFDTVPATKNKWIRLRTDGTKATLALKISKSDAVDGVEEYETEVDNFDQTRQILQLSGLTESSYQENSRQLFEIDGLEISIDSWPKIPPYLEIEGKNDSEVTNMLKKLDLESYKTTSLPTKDVYQMYGLNLDELNPLTF